MRAVPAFAWSQQYPHCDGRPLRDEDFERVDLTSDELGHEPKIDYTQLPVKRIVERV